jgi:hypothetical protein
LLIVCHHRLVDIRSHSIPAELCADIPATIPGPTSAYIVFLDCAPLVTAIKSKQIPIIAGFVPKLDAIAADGKTGIWLGRTSPGAVEATFNMAMGIATITTHSVPIITPD